MSGPFRVDFMIVGAQKCGTTTLSQVLRSHPSVVCSYDKETNFFSTCSDWRAEIARYERMFPRREGAHHFEASPTYTFYPYRNLEIWNDLHDFNPHLKVVYLVRNPIERVTSAYMHMYERGYTDRTFEAALVEIPQLLDVTRYATQIKPFLERFGEDQVRILFFEDLLRQRRALQDELGRFLDIDPDGFGDVAALHANPSIGGNKAHYKYDRPPLFLRAVRRIAPPLWRVITDNSRRTFSAKPVLSPRHQRVVLHMLRAEIDELEALTGRKLSHWRRISPGSSLEGGHPGPQRTGPGAP
jgi:hypothetical protein